jgi:hypothetical protein
MPMLRFSLLTLAALVAAVAVACAALINASPLIASLSWSATVLGLALAAVAAVLSTSKRRGFWTGFAIVGWAFTILTISPLSGDLQSSLLTTALVQRAARAMPQAQEMAIFPPAPVYYTPYAQTLPDGSVTVASPAAPKMNVSSPAPPPVPASAAPAIVSYPVTTYAPYLAPASRRFSESFVQIGEALSVLILALAGGLLGQYLMVRNERRAVA